MCVCVFVCVCACVYVYVYVFVFVCRWYENIESFRKLLFNGALLFVARAVDQLTTAILLGFVFFALQMTLQPCVASCFCSGLPTRYCA